MRIESADRRSWVSISLNEDIEAGHRACTIAADVDTGHGRFTGENRDLYLLNLGDFVIALDAFITDRSLRPRLDATYDTFIEISGGVSRVVVTFSVGDAVSGGKTVRFHAAGAFEIDQEQLMSIVRYFQSHANAA